MDEGSEQQQGWVERTLGRLCVDHPLQSRMLQLVSLLSSVVALGLVTPMNAGLGLPWGINAAVVSFGLLSLWLYIESRRGRHRPGLQLLLIATVLNVNWFLNGGSQGSVGFTLFAVVLLVPIFLTGWKRHMAIALWMVDGLALVAVDYRWPGLGTPYPNAAVRAGDLMSGFVVACVTAALSIWVVLDSYERARGALAQALHRAEAASRAKSEFLANISHEVRTPLNGMLGTMALLQHVELPERERRLVSAAEQSGADLLRLVDDLLDVARIESGRIELRPVEFSLRDLLDDLVMLTRQEAGDKGLDLNCTVDPQVPGRLYGDASRLRQILSNLLTNAVKFTDQGSVRVEVAVVSTDGDSVDLRFEVIDTGAGIPAERLHELFVPFSQLDGSSTRRHGGTGLGLAISRRLARAMGGDLEVRSQPGEGSVFFFQVRFEVREAVAGPVSGLQVLLVEDNNLNYEVACAMLTRQGCHVVRAADGAAGVEAYRAGRYDLILMDCHMPEMDGYSASQAIRQYERGGRRTPIIAMTAAGLPEDATRREEVGMDDFLPKPITMDDVRRILLRWGHRTLDKAGKPY